MADSDDFDRALAWARGLRRNQFDADDWDVLFLRNREADYIRYAIERRSRNRWSPRCVDDIHGVVTHEREFKTFSEAKQWLIAMILTGH
jgi:hypothetical protein